MFTTSFNLGNRYHLQKGDRLFVGFTQVSTQGDLPETIKDGEVLVWVTDKVRNGDGWTICMEPTGDDQPEVVCEEECPAPTQCEIDNRCFAGKCKSIPRKEGYPCDD